MKPRFHNRDFRDFHILSIITILRLKHSANTLSFIITPGIHKLFRGICFFLLFHLFFVGCMVFY